MPTIIPPVNIPPGFFNPPPPPPIPKAQPGDFEAMLGLVNALNKAFQPKPSGDDIMDKIRRAGGIIDNWGNVDPQAKAQAVGPEMRGRPRALSPMEGPDVGEADLSDTPQGYFAKTRGAESSNNKNARNPWSDAGGYYQFMPATWASIMKAAPDLGLTDEGRTGTGLDEKEARRQQDAAMRHYTGASVQALKPIIGDRQPTGGELYMLHLFGQKGGSNVMSNLDAPLRGMFNKQVFDWNPMLKDFETGRQLLSAFNKRFG